MRNGRTLYPAFVIALLLAAATAGAESEPFLVKDIVPGASGSCPEGLTNVNGTLFFLAFDPTHSFELWKSDGTAAGTVLVKDILPGGASSNSSQFTDVNGTLFFTALDPAARDLELWKSDGTAAGTVLIKDVRPRTELTNVNGALFFVANDGTNGVGLWKSDGTAAGTVVKDINPGAASSFPFYLTNVNGTLFFSVFSDPTNGPELWALVLEPTALIQQLIADVTDLNLQQGIANSLDGKLDAAQKALEDINSNNDAAAINALQAVINSVEAQRGNKIPEADADALIAAAQAIIDLLEGS